MGVSFLTILNEQPELMVKARELALTVNDESIDPVKRAVAAIQLSDLCGDATIEAAKRQLAEPPTQPSSEPKYKFVNGAKVRVKE